MLIKASNVLLQQFSLLLYCRADGLLVDLSCAQAKVVRPLALELDLTPHMLAAKQVAAVMCGMLS